MAITTIAVPSHDHWKLLKTKYGIPKGAVSGISIGKELDAYHNGLKAGQFSGNHSLAFELEKKLRDYVTKIDKKKITKLTYDAFKNEFTTNYANKAKSAQDELRSSCQIAVAFTNAHSSCTEKAALLPDKVEKPVDIKKRDTGLKAIEVLQKFRKEPVALLLRRVQMVRGADVADIHQLWKFIDKAIESVNKDTPDHTLTSILKMVKTAGTKSDQLLAGKNFDV